MRYVALLTLSVLLASCAVHEVLIAKSAIVPAGLNLSGQWQLRKESSDTLGKRLPRGGGERFELPPRKANSKKRARADSLARNTALAKIVASVSGLSRRSVYQAGTGNRMWSKH